MSQQATGGSRRVVCREPLGCWDVMQGCRARWPGFFGDARLAQVKVIVTKIRSLFPEAPFVVVVQKDLAGPKW